MATIIVSFGFRYGKPREAGEPGALCIDIRPWFNNPHHDRSLRYLTGFDAPVQAEIQADPSFSTNYYALRQRVMGHLGPVWLGCTGGRHRSVYLADRLARELKIPVLHWSQEHWR